MGRDQDPVIGGTMILPLAIPVLDCPPGDTQRFDSSRLARPADNGTPLRPRDERVAMIGAGYRAIIEGRPAALVNLSLSGAQLKAAVRVRPEQPAIVKIGWHHDDRHCAVLARVRWVQFEPDATTQEGLYRVGMVFETWDVARLKEIMRHLSPRRQV
jgi:hypothetical protein